MRFYRRHLNIFYKDHVTNEEVRSRIQNVTGVHDDLLTMIKKRKLRWYGHISRSSGMARQFCRGQWNERRQKKRREYNIKEWTRMEFGDSLRTTEDRERWKGTAATSSVVPRRPSRLRDCDEINLDKQIFLFWCLLVRSKRSLFHLMAYLIFYHFKIKNFVS